MTEGKPRRYGRCVGWNGTEEDPDRCVAKVHSPGFLLPHQCLNPRGHGPERLYCPTHALWAEAGLYDLLLPDGEPVQQGQE